MFIYLCFYVHISICIYIYTYLCISYMYLYVKHIEPLSLCLLTVDTWHLLILKWINESNIPYKIVRWNMIPLLFHVCTVLAWKTTGTMWFVELRSVRWNAAVDGKFLCLLVFFASCLGWCVSFIAFYCLVIKFWPTCENVEYQLVS